MSETIPIASSDGTSSPSYGNPRYKTALAIGFGLIAALGISKMASSQPFSAPTTMRQSKKSLVPQQYWINCYPGGDIAEYFGIGSVGIYETPSLTLKCIKPNQRVISCSCGNTDGFVPTGSDFDWEGNSCECLWRTYWGRPFGGEYTFRGAVTCATFIMKNETMPECSLNSAPQTAL